MQVFFHGGPGVVYFGSLAQINLTKALVISYNCAFPAMSSQNVVEKVQLSLSSIYNLHHHSITHRILSK